MGIKLFIILRSKNVFVWSLTEIISRFQLKKKASFLALRIMNASTELRPRKMCVNFYLFFPYFSIKTNMYANLLLLVGLNDKH